MTHSIASERLRDLLNYWKDGCHFLEETNRISGETASIPHVRNWRSLERQIFDTRVEELDTEQWDCGKFRTMPFFTRTASFPYELFQWNRKSRRVYHLPSELQRPFSQATFPDVRVRDVKLPFDSFIITLEEPITIDQEAARNEPPTIIDTLWITRMADGSIKCRLLYAPATPGPLPRLSPNAVRRCELAWRRGQDVFVREFSRQWRRWERTMVSIPGELIIPLWPKDTSDNALVSDLLIPKPFPRDVSLSLSDQTYHELEWMAEWTSAIARIVVGWCVYLKHIPSENYTWLRLDTPKDRGTRGLSTGTITDPEHICTILKIASMDIGKYREKYPPEKDSKFFHWPHWKSGHWKRERGAGPLAPKTRWIKPYKVREDLEPLFGIHGGTMTIVKDEM